MLLTEVNKMNKKKAFGRGQENVKKIDILKNLKEHGMIQNAADRQ